MLSILSYYIYISAKEFFSGFVLIVEEIEITIAELKLLLLAQLPTVLGSFGIQPSS